MTEEEIVSIIVKNAEQNGCVCIPQFKLGVGLYAGAEAKRMDLLAIHPKDGKIHGFEIKSSRTDFLSDLNKPSKMIAYQAPVDALFYVLAPGVIKLEDYRRLPYGIGLMTIKNNKLKQERAAKEVFGSCEPSRSFWLSVVKHLAR